MNHRKLVVLIVLLCLFGLPALTSAAEINNPDNYFKYYAEKKDPGLAAFSALYIPSLGHYVAGDWLRSWPYLIGDILSIGMLLSFQNATPGGGYYLTWGGVLAACKIAETIDAYNTAEDHNTKLAKSYSLDFSIAKEQDQIMYMRDGNHTMLGVIGWDGSSGIGTINMDELGYPHNAINFNLLGLTYSWYWGTPSKEDIYNATLMAKGDKNNLPAYKEEIKAKVKKEWYNYFRVGTLLVYPIFINSGWETRINDSIRFSYGFGLPLLFNFGLGIDI